LARAAVNGDRSSQYSILWIETTLIARVDLRTVERSAEEIFDGDHTVLVVQV
jgi:hypothetical protein